VRYKGRLDVMLARSAPGTVVAGVFTRSATRSAAVLWCEEKIAATRRQGVQGRRDPGQFRQFQRLHRRAGQAVAVDALARTGRGRVPQGRVFTASTGVIGEPLPHERIVAKLGDLAAGLSPDGLRRRRARS
jgi:glutamate N-acetyltransferase / amino-acid N-acetyltransferase